MIFPPSLVIPPEVLDIARQLEDGGYETWCVGGAVRDNLLQHDNHDFDLATAATPQVVQQLFRRTVPIGVEHGTVAVLDGRGGLHEVTTFRRDVRTDGRHAVVEFGVSLEDDLARRDFTINAIAYHPFRRDWRDPFDGASDLTARVIRAVGDPGDRFREDHLRIVRALRFAARFDFAIDDATWSAARAAADGLSRLSAERVRDEWFKGLTTAGRPSELVRLWGAVGAVERWLPEVEPHEGIDVLPRDPVLLTAFISRDPASTLTRLRASNADIERARRVAAHGEGLPTPNARDVRHWLATVGDVWEELLAVASARGDASTAGALAEVVGTVLASGAPLAIADLAVTGRDVMEAGVAQGPAVGRVLQRLLEDVLDHPERNERAELVRRVHRLVAEGGT